MTTPAFPFATTSVSGIFSTQSNHLSFSISSCHSNFVLLKLHRCRCACWCVIMQTRWTHLAKAAFTENFHELKVVQRKLLDRFRFGMRSEWLRRSMVRVRHSDDTHPCSSISRSVVGRWSRNGQGRWTMHRYFKYDLVGFVIENFVHVWIFIATITATVIDVSFWLNSMNTTALRTNWKQYNVSLITMSETMNF